MHGSSFFLSVFLLLFFVAFFFFDKWRHSFQPLRRLKSIGTANRNDYNVCIIMLITLNKQFSKPMNHSYIPPTSSVFLSFCFLSFFNLPFSIFSSHFPSLPAFSCIHFHFQAVGHYSVFAAATNLHVWWNITTQLPYLICTVFPHSRLELALN